MCWLVLLYQYTNTVKEIKMNALIKCFGKPGIVLALKTIMKFKSK